MMEDDMVLKIRPDEDGLCLPLQCLRARGAEKKEQAQVALSEVQTALLRAGWMDMAQDISLWITRFWDGDSKYIAAQVWNFVIDAES